MLRFVYIQVPTIVLQKLTVVTKTLIVLIMVIPIPAVVFPGTLVTARYVQVSIMSGI